jgi:mitochondrial enoyl-[acyl-carrier protein] reductase / trans-2-enoyl-CoA reductase
MKTITYNEIGDPSQVLYLEDVETPALGPGDARVAVLATPIHPSNLLQISGHYGTKPQLPATPGSEGVGRVIEVADDVTGLQVGQTVLLAGYNTWRQELSGPAASFIPVPDGADIQQLSMIVVNPMTALRLLDSFAELKEGDWVIQSAANSAVGEYLIQLAKQRGIKTINVVRRESAIQGLMDLGADHVLVDGPDLTEQLKGVADGAPLALAFDAVGGDTFTNMVNALSYGGTMVCYGLLSMEMPTLPSTAVIFNDVRVKGFWLSQWFKTASPEEKQRTFAEIIGLVANGSLKTKVSQTFSLDEIQEAVKVAAASGRDGKVLLLPNPQ